MASKKTTHEEKHVEPEVQDTTDMADAPEVANASPQTTESAIPLDLQRVMAAMQVNG
jgi:hypothetical protein